MSAATAAADAEALCDAAFHGDVPRLLSLLRERPHLRNVADVCEAACRAARRNHACVLRALLERGLASAHELATTRAASGFTALGIAAYHGARDAIRFLVVRAKANLRAPAAVRIGRTPLDGARDVTVCETALELAKKHKRWQTAQFIVSLRNQRESWAASAIQRAARDARKASLRVMVVEKPVLVRWAERVRDGARLDGTLERGDVPLATSSIAGAGDSGGGSGGGGGPSLVKMTGAGATASSSSSSSSSIGAGKKKMGASMGGGAGAGSAAMHDPSMRSFLGLESGALRKRRALEAGRRREAFRFSKSIEAILKLHNPAMLPGLPGLIERTCRGGGGGGGGGGGALGGSVLDVGVGGPTQTERLEKLLKCVERKYGLAPTGFKANQLPAGLGRGKLWVTIQEERDAARQKACAANAAVSLAESRMFESMENNQTNMEKAKKRRLEQLAKQAKEIEKSRRRAARRAARVPKRPPAADVPPELAPSSRVIPSASATPVRLALPTLVYPRSAGDEVQVWRPKAPLDPRHPGTNRKRTGRLLRSHGLRAAEGGQPQCCVSASHCSSLDENACFAVEFPSGERDYSVPAKAITFCCGDAAAAAAAAGGGHTPPRRLPVKVWHTWEVRAWGDDAGRARLEALRTAPRVLNVEEAVKGVLIDTQVFMVSGAAAQALLL